MRLALYALTPAGLARARRLGEHWPQAALFASLRLEAADARAMPGLAATLAANFGRYEGHVLFAATGIVVRALAGLPRGKDRDPAVVVCDQEGQWAISLLSGHLGGANDLAREVAALLGGQAVITTATDSAGLPSLEVLAARRGLKVENLGALAGFSGALLAGQTPAVWDPEGWLAPALEPWRGRLAWPTEAPDPAAQPGPLAWVGPQGGAFPAGWLILRPACLWLGVGCNRGTAAAEILDLIERTLAEHGLAPASLAGMASVDLKADEPGLAQAARALGLPIKYYSRPELGRVAVPNPSGRVESHIGVQSVCEAAAILASGRGPLVVTKTKTPNATLAVARSRAASSM